MMDGFYWTMAGRPAGFIDNDAFWAANGRYVGRVAGGLIFSASTGAYIGETYGEDRVLIDPRRAGRRRTPSSRNNRSARSRSSRSARMIPSGKRDWQA